MKKITFAAILSTVLLLSSCALRPIPSEYSFVKTDLDSVNIDNLGNGQILIYNGANFLHRLDNTARLNAWIDNKALGQIRPAEFVIINLENGTYEFKLLHIDIVNMRSEHEVIIDNGIKVIKIRPTLTSNDLEVTNELPSNFEKFSYSEQR